MEPQTTKTGSTDGPILSIRPQSHLVFNAFKGLQQKAERVLDLARTETAFPSVRHVTLFVRCLQSEFLNFRETLAELTDNNYSEVEGGDWTVVELAVESRCVSEYARYSNLLNRILQELGNIAERLGLTEYLRSDKISDLVSSDDRRARLLQALCTLDGSGGAALQISFTRIQQANEELVQIRRLSQKDPPANFFNNLLPLLRKHVSAAAQILGTENGFHCQCSESHQVYLRIKDCFKPGESEHASQAWHQACSLLFHNPSPGDKQWEPVDMEFKIEEATMSETPEQENGGEIASKKINEKLEEKMTEETEKKKRWPPAPLPLMTTDPSDGLCAFLNDKMGARQEYPMDITIHRQNSSYKLLLRLSDGRTKPGVGWANPLPIRRRPEDIHRLELSTEQKLRLAHKIAFSLFYLFSTPWIRDTWTSEDVYLTWQGSSDGIVYPVFSRTAAGSSASVNASSIQEPSQPRIPFTNCLGRLLVELWCGTSWSHIRKAFLAGDGPSGEVDTDTFIFTKLLNWVSNSRIADRDKPFHLEGGSYFMAVQKCFMCDCNPCQLGRASPSDNENFARWIYRHVLRPLQYALEDFQIRHDRLFGTRLDLSTEINTPRSAGETRRLRLYDNEEIKGDQKKKEEAADAWFDSYGGVKKLVRYVGRERPDNPTDRVRIAILDTGVDVTHDDLHGPWIEGQIVYQNFVRTRTGMPQDDDGHGTHVTSILLRMAENVDIYVARVSADGVHWRSSEVEDAIRWAANDKQVHIISMSFGYPNADQSLEGIRRALLEAHATDVLIFAATGNNGNGDAIAFPACLDEVISVASTDGNHQLSSFVPDLRVGKRLCAIGEAIEAAWIDQKGSATAHCSQGRKAGTSYATPVVAGVAAMVMDLIWSAKEHYEYQCQMLRTNQGMLAVLELMIWKDRKNETECLKPWMFFNERRWKSFSKREESYVGSADGFVILADTLYNIYGKGSSKR